jgi:hypothetical protein
MNLDEYLAWLVDEFLLRQQVVQRICRVSTCPFRDDVDCSMRLFRMRKRPYAWAIAWHGLAKITGRYCHNGDSLPGHVEKLNAIAVFFARDDMAFDHRTDVTCAEAVFGDVGGQNHILEQLNGHYRFSG